MLRSFAVLALLALVGCGASKPFDGDGYEITIPVEGYEYTRVVTGYPGDKWVNSVGGILVQRIDDIPPEGQSLQGVREYIGRAFDELGFVETSATTVTVPAGDAYRIAAANADGENETVAFGFYNDGIGWIVYFQAAPASKADELIDSFSLDLDNADSPVGS